VMRWQRWSCPDYREVVKTHISIEPILQNPLMDSSEVE
jgi:hypothetical protein